MASVWSFNTTVRNPERMQNFLRVLKEFEGRVFDEECQKDFFALQIQKRLYKPTSRTLVNPLLIGEVNKKTAEEIPEDTLKKIIDLYIGRNVDASARGRTTAGILNRFGLCIASKARGQVKITELGKKWLDNKIDDQELFFKFLLKWQYPNPLEEGYSEFNIKPFVATLSLLHKVNKKWKELGNDPVGLGKKEFMLFVPSLKNHQEIEETARKIIEYRTNLQQKHNYDRKEYEDNFTLRRVEVIFSTKEALSKKISDLKDYTDSALRYFRMTEFIYLRGNDTHIDLAPDHKIEIERLILTDNASANKFSSTNEYLGYLLDRSLPALPWENKEDLTQIKSATLEMTRTMSRDTNKESDFEDVVQRIETEDLAKQIKELKDFKNGLQIEKLRGLKYDKGKLRELITLIPKTMSDRTPTVTTRPSLDLEWFVSLSLMVLNDTKGIFPSYKIGDDNLPTGFASNIADIECLYESFGMIVEVTLLMGRDQWYAEGQPVMQHFRDFEDKYSSYGENAYCLFIAPYLHRGTLNTFWNASKGIGGYEGRSQRIIPIRIDQYVKILSFINDCLILEKKPKHEKYEELLTTLHSNISKVENVYQWLETFDNTIDDWGKSLVNYANK